jgi:hypothetical protein
MITCRFREENAIQIQLNTNIAEPVITYSEGGEEWLAFDKRSDFVGKVTLSFKAAKNVTYKERSATSLFQVHLLRTL